VLRSRQVFAGHGFKAVRTGVTALFLVTAVVPLAGRAVGEESASDLKARMASIQARLDASTARIEGLRDKLERTYEEVAATEARMKILEKQDARLEAEVIDRATALYKSGGAQVLEVLFGSDSIAELSSAAEALSQVSIVGTDAFTRLARSRAELHRLKENLIESREHLRADFEELKEEHQKQQALFDSVAADYERLRDQIAPAAPSAARIRGSGGMFCPVAGPTSFTDTYGAPRSGHTHQGVDMMGAYGTPLVAIVSGTITYAAYDGSGGNMIFLSGDDGNAYWYMHNQENLVSGGHVSAGQQIATLGDTGNAAGTPHLHFEYHPGGGSAVNPTPLVASIC
jgi:peptidoglycan LD-endopeptidase LytH